MLTEGYIQSGYFYPFYLPTAKAVTRKEAFRRGVKTLPLATKVLTSLALVVLVIAFLPALFVPETPAYVSKAQEVIMSDNQLKNLSWQPSVDPGLSLEPKVVISSIGVDTTIQEGSYENLELALRKGVWRANDFGTPFDRSQPTILAAHRFGYLLWSNSFRRENSFFSLPKLKMGEMVEITWKQRKYMYVVYAESEGTQITDYNADLILYTCTDLTTDNRVFKYAKLILI